MKEEILKSIGIVVVWIGSIAAAVFAIFRFSLEKWIENKFSERLEEFKHKQNKEIEELRFKINTIFNRLTKIHDKELEILPESWNLLQDAIGRVADFTSIYQFSYDLNIFSPQQLEEFLSKSDLSVFLKNELKQKPDKSAYYKEIISWHKERDAKNAQLEFHNFFIRNRIFMTIELQKLFANIDDIMQNSMILKTIEKEDIKASVEAYKKMRDEINPIRDKIEKAIQARLRFEDA